jgi:hypothetical protein
LGVSSLSSIHADYHMNRILPDAKKLQSFPIEG